MKRDVAALAHLLAAGANLDLADNDGNTPLHYSQFDSTDQISLLLLAAGANVQARNNQGRTACHDASDLSHVSLAALLAFGANLDEPDNDGIMPRQLLKRLPPTNEEIALARRRVFTLQVSLVRKRAVEISIALQSLDLDALCMCEILLHSCGPVARFIPFHIWWQIATLVKHFHER